MLRVLERVSFASWVLIVGAALIAPRPAAAAAQKRPAAKSAHKPPAKARHETAIDMAAIQTQVMLDRAGYSPGEIDGAPGTSTKRALDAYLSHQALDNVQLALDAEPPLPDPRSGKLREVIASVHA